MRRLATVAVALAGVFTAGAMLAGPPADALQEDAFPHVEHQGLFPLCTGCHEGIPAGDAAEWYPEPASCAGCHDGVDRDEVSWSGPSSRIDNVEFDHAEHATELESEGDPAQACAECHIASGGGRMEVAAEIQVANCWSCHAHETDDHYDVAAECESCHLPLASTGFVTDRIASLPKPASHESGQFVAEDHGSLASGRSDRCATCHTQERCVSCHVDTELDAIAALPRAPASMDLPPMVAVYPEPASHVDDGWLSAHQVQAEVRECSTCHTTNDCRTCHIANVPDLVSSLPSRAESTAPGVMLESRSPDSHDSRFFLQAHSVLSASDPATCETCHVDRFCVECHESEVGGGYHPPNFMVRHSGDAFSRDGECANCHQASVFCRECHTDLGLAGARVATAG